MIWAILTAVIALVCAAKYITARSGNASLDKIFLKLHAVGGMLIQLTAGIHTALLFRRNADPVSKASWICVDAGIAGLLCSHMFMKKLGKKSMQLHRLFTLFTLAALAFHTAYSVLRDFRRA